MVVCAPVTGDGAVDPRWGRAARVAIADVQAGVIASWREFDVRWDVQHDLGTEGAHHARVAGFLRDHHVELVVANHMGPPMVNMLDQMGIRVRLEASGNARDAILATTAARAN
jgi:predicted Fe-Mo cluster-binding NifX family protein